MAGGGPGFITITISGAQQFDLKVRQFDSWGMAIRDLTPAWTEIGEDLLGDFAQNMVREGGFFGGGTWPPLAASTIADKQRQGYGMMPMLWRTGELAESLSERNAPGNIFDARPDSLTVGTSVRYAGFHQYGTSRMLRRSIVGISFARRSLIVKRLDDFIREQARAAGLAMAGS